MRLAKERKVRSGAWLQCAEAAQLEWPPRITVLGKKLLDINDMQSDRRSLLWLKGKAYHG